MSLKSTSFKGDSVSYQSERGLRTIVIMCSFHVLCHLLQSVPPDWLWSGVGFRLDDRVCREDRVTHVLTDWQWRHVRSRPSSPPPLFLGSPHPPSPHPPPPPPRPPCPPASPRHRHLLCPLFRLSSELFPPLELLLLLFLRPWKCLSPGSSMSWLSRLNPRGPGSRAGRSAAPSSPCTADPETCLMVFENHWRQVSQKLSYLIIF